MDTLLRAGLFVMGAFAVAYGFALGFLPDEAISQSRRWLLLRDGLGGLFGEKLVKLLFSSLFVGVGLVCLYGAFKTSKRNESRPKG